MAPPERPQSNTFTSPTLSELAIELDEVNRQLEINDDNENQIERFFRRDDLLEQQDQIQDEIDELNPSERL
jgi:dynactin complex subunit